jgi:uncharacterized zinc-type alcohol dehydrogenase-like protein
VTAFSTSPSKEAEARRLGAHHFILAKDAGAMEKVANSHEFIISTAPGDVDWMAYLNVLKPKGKLCIVGVPPGELRLPAFPLIAGRKSLFGSPVGSPWMIREMLDFAACNRVLPVLECYPMAEVNTVFGRVRGNQVRYRAVLVN